VGRGAYYLLHHSIETRVGSFVSEVLSCRSRFTQRTICKSIDRFKKGSKSHKFQNTELPCANLPVCCCFVMHVGGE
jgi:hypothetical protein